MAAGTEIPQAICVLGGGGGVYSPPPLDSAAATTKEKIVVVVAADKEVCEERKVCKLEGEVATKPPSTSDPIFFCNGSSCVTASCLSKLIVSDEQGVSTVDTDEGSSSEFMPIIRSGGWAEKGCRRIMEDAHVRIDDLVEHLGPPFFGNIPRAFYAVFDGHDGNDAANFARENLLRFIVEDCSFPNAVEEAVKRAFVQADHAFAEACILDKELSSGTTALTVLIFGRTLLVANAGDCRAVLSRRGRAVEMSRDHKPSCATEKIRIESLGGYVDDGYLNGQLSVARALGDWHIEGLKASGVGGPLTAEPEMEQAVLTEEDEFMIIGCDGLWDVFTSQNAIDFARKKLQQHNDPERCSNELVAEALRRETLDNLTVLTVCFHSAPPPIAEPAPRIALNFAVRRNISVEALRSLQMVLNDAFENS